MLRSCLRCNALLSPWESSLCLTCSNRKPPARVGIPDAAVRVLEREESPVKVHDVSRAIDRDLGKPLAMASLQIALSQDRRVCWAGKGLYGLFRHGIYPGPRNLIGAALLLMHAHGEPVEVYQLGFVMKYTGYRFQDTSLLMALRTEADVRWITNRHCRIPDDAEITTRLLSLGVAPTVEQFTAVVDHARQLMRSGLEEYRRRLSQ
jgi:hypothetical protein